MKNFYSRCLIHCGDLNNVGDMALLLRGTEVVRSIHPNMRVIITSWSKYNSDVERIIGESAITNINAKTLGAIWAARNSLYVIGGGQLVRANASLYALAMLAIRTTFSKITGGTVICHGLGVSKMESPIKRALWKNILKMSSHVAVRDEKSFANAKIIAPDANIVLTADLMLGEAARPHISDEQIIVAPCDDLNEGRSFLSESSIKLVLRAISRWPDAKLVFLAHDTRDSMDVAAARRFIEAAAIPSMRYEIVNSNHVGTVMGYYQRSALVITNRLHSLIFAFNTASKAICIADGGKKTAEMAAALGVPELPIDGRSSDADLDRVLDSALTIEQTSPAAAELRRRSSENVLLLERLVS